MCTLSKRNNNAESMNNLTHACTGTEDLKCPITCELMRDPVLAAGKNSNVN